MVGPTSARGAERRMGVQRAPSHHLLQALQFTSKEIEAQSQYSRSYIFLWPEPQESRSLTPKHRASSQTAAPNVEWNMLLKVNLP